MDFSNVPIPTDAYSEESNLNLSEDKDGKITVGQQLSIQQPKPEEYITISKWDLGRIRKQCGCIKKESGVLPDFLLTIGSLALGAFFSYLFSGVDITNSKWRLAIFIVLLAVGVGTFISAAFLKTGEHNDVKKSADDIEEILAHICSEDKEELQK